MVAATAADTVAWMFGVAVGLGVEVRVAVGRGVGVGGTGLAHATASTSTTRHQTRADCGLVNGCPPFVMVGELTVSPP